MPNDATQDVSGGGIPGENPRENRSRLRWRCRRGMRELDVVLERFLERDYTGAPPAEQRAFEALLELQDPQVLAYLLGQDTPADADLANLIHKLTQPGVAFPSP
jgi:antitoxin CptB